MDVMDELLKCLNNVDYSAFDDSFITELLNMRDSDMFDKEWCRIYKEIETIKNTRNYTDKNRKEQHEIREKSFIIMEQNVKSELSAYVSDDFGLIYDSFVLNYKDEWLDKLIKEYQNKKIPMEAF